MKIIIKFQANQNLMINTDLSRYLIMILNYRLKLNKIHLIKVKKIKIYIVTANKVMIKKV